MEHDVTGVPFLSDNTNSWTTGNDVYYSGPITTGTSDPWAEGVASGWKTTTASPGLPSGWKIATTNIPWGEHPVEITLICTVCEEEYSSESYNSLVCHLCEEIVRHLRATFMLDQLKELEELLTE
jgi:hypothetical protein